MQRYRRLISYIPHGQDTYVSHHWGWMVSLGESGGGDSTDHTGSFQLCVQDQADAGCGLNFHINTAEVAGAQRPGRHMGRENAKEMQANRTAS